MKPKRMTEPQKADLLTLLGSVPEVAELHEALRLHFLAEDLDAGKELPLDRSDSKEMLSIWYDPTTSKTKIGCIPMVLPEAEAWGHILMGIVRNVSGKWPGDREPQEVMRQIRAGFDKAWTEEFDAPPEVH